MLKIPKVSLEPVRYVLRQSDPSGETYVVVRPATMVDEARRLQMLLDGSESILNINVIAVELYLTLQESNILDEEGNILLDPSLPFEEFLQRMTAVWRYNPTAVQELHEAVLQANPQWRLEGNVEGNS